MQARLMEAPKKKRAASRDKNDWREIVRAWQKSNEHPKDFCTRMNIKFVTFAYWRSIFKKEDKSQGNKFIEIEITPEAHHLEQFIIECPSGHKIILSSALKIEQAQVIFKLLGVTV